MRVTTRHTNGALLRTIGALIMLANSLVACTVRARPAPPSSRPRALVIPFQLRENQIFVQVNVDDSLPLTFVLDTGAPYNLIGLHQARSLGLPLQSLGKVIQGVGASPPDAYVVTRTFTLRLGDVALASQALVAVPLEMPPECTDLLAGRANSTSGVRGGAGDVMEGVLGKPLFDRFVIDIDYAGRRIAFHEPGGYRYDGRGTTLPFRMAGGIPVVDARVAVAPRRSATARLAVDLGAATAITINKQFADSHRILPPPEALRATNECGVGGAAAGTSFEGLLHTVEIGPVTLRNPMTFFRRNPNGRGFDGLLGGGALRDFRVILDYSDRRMILEHPATSAR